MKKWEIVWGRKWKGNTSVEELELMKEGKSRAMLGKDNQSGMKQLGSESGVELVASTERKQEEIWITSFQTIVKIGIV